MAIKAVIWDYGGVLVRTEDLGPRSRLAEQLGLDVEELSKLIFNSANAEKGMRGKISGVSHWEQVGEELGIDAQQLQDEFFAGDVLDEDLMGFIRELRAIYRIGLLSNAFGSLRQHMEEGRKIADAFDEIIISAEVGLMKPEAAIYTLTLEQMGVAADEAIFVDDFVENVEGAQQVGMQAIHFRSREQTLAELAELLDH